MPPFVTPFTTMGDSAAASTGSPPATTTTTTTPVRNKRSPFLHQFNDVGGRPDERLGTRGSFTPGVRVMSGGPARDVPLKAEIDHGKVLFVSSALKPDLSGEPRTNVAGGRPDERLGSRGSFTPGTNKTFLGGVPRNVPVKAEIDHGEVLFVSSLLKPDLSGEARMNVAGGRPTERLGTRGSFTPGVRRWAGGEPRDVPVKPETIDHGKVLFVSSALKPDLSYLPAFNVAGGRPTERFGTRGSFTRGVRIMSGGPARDMPFQTAATSPTTNHGKVLFESSVLKPDLSGELRANVVGGRPEERLGGYPGRFAPGVRRWLGGEPRDVPAGREVSDHGTVLFVSSDHEPDALRFPQDQQRGSPPSFGNARGNDSGNGHDNGGVAKAPLEKEETMVGEGRQVPGDAAGTVAAKEAMGRVNGGSCNDLAKRNESGGGGGFRRCGSDSQFNNAGTHFSMSNPSCRPSF